MKSVGNKLSGKPEFEQNVSNSTRLQRERHAIWARVCADYYHEALDHARRRVGSKDDAFVIVQDSAVRVLRLLPDPSRVDNQRNYWIKVVQNQCNDMLRRRTLAAARTVSLDMTFNDDDADEVLTFDRPHPSRDPEINAEINEETEKLLRELESHTVDLTKREKDLLGSRLQGLSNSQIARAWGEDVNAIRCDMNAIMAKIRYRLMHQGKANGKKETNSLEATLDLLLSRIEFRESLDGLKKRAGINVAEFDQFFNLLMVQGMTFDEAAADLGEDANHTRYRWYYLLSRIKAQLHKDRKEIEERLHHAA
jgi:RNA polymerase sigma factor (sigma-70 family)